MRDSLKLAIELLNDIQNLRSANFIKRTKENGNSFIEIQIQANRDNRLMIDLQNAINPVLHNYEKIALTTVKAIIEEI
jgi:hypothetical protein